MPAEKTPATESRRGAVLDPQWEVALRAGQEAEGEHGTVEDELAIIHLLRHARAPQALDDGVLDRAWEGIDEQLSESAATSGWRAWLRRPWLLGGGVAMAAAAAAAIIIVWPGSTPDPGSQPSALDGADEVVASADMAATIEAQFAVLEPGARAAVKRSVEAGRGDLRGQLVAAAKAADGTPGGAP